MKSFQMELSLFIESYEYIDLKKGRKINFQRDPSKIEEIIFEDNEIQAINEPSVEYRMDLPF